MEEPKRPNCAEDKKQVVVNIGRVSTHRGGGIGGVILLGGALATAAFASAFIFGRKRRGGRHDNSHRNTHTPPPTPPAAVNNKDERDVEANGKGGSTFPDANKQSSETIKRIELKNDNQSLVLYEKQRTEINGVAACDGETSEQILRPITPKRPENGAISNGGASHFPAGEERSPLPLEIKKTAVHHAKIQSSGEATIDENGIVEESKDSEEVEAEGEGKDAREIVFMGKIQEVKFEDTKGSNGNYVPEIGLKSREGTFTPEHGKNGQESSLPVVGSPTSKHENITDDEKPVYLSSKEVEIIHDGEAIQQDEEDENQHQHAEEHLVQEREKCDEPDEEIVTVKGEEEKEGRQCEENIEEKGSIDNSTPENRQLGDSGKEDVQILAMHLPEDELISPDEMSVSDDDAVNGEIEIPFYQKKDSEDEVERKIENEDEDSSETIATGIATAKDEEDINDGTDGDEDLDEVGLNTEDTIDNSMESDLGDVWPAEVIQESSIETQQEKLVDQEIEGKIQEDLALKLGKYELHPNKIIAGNTQITNGRCNSTKNFIDRHMADLATLKYYPTNSGTRNVLLVAIPVLSAVSCSWFFGLSFDKFCFVVLLTIVLSKSMIVK